jgi:hypothetical protein
MSRQLPVIDLEAISRRAARQSRPQFHWLAEVIDDYIRGHRMSAAADMAFFLNESFPVAIEYAALYKLANGHRHPHSYRRKLEALEEAYCRLLAVAGEMRKCSSFEELHDLIEREIGGIPDIGPLTVYDVATRIGAHLQLEPEKVYLHSGTKKGARELGLGARRKTLEKAVLPGELGRLAGREIEDCLCIYKDYLGVFRA